MQLLIIVCLVSPYHHFTAKLNEFDPLLLG